MPAADEGVEAALRAAIEAYVATPEGRLIRHTVQVTSFGGSGTTAICNHLTAAGVDLQPGPGHYPFKHRRHPPTAGEVPDGFRVIYPIGDPRDAVLSVFRRNLQRGHYECLHEQGPPSPEVGNRLASLEAFLTAGVDEFGLADHVARWEAHPPGYPVLFVRLDHLSETWDDVAQFAGLAPDGPPLPTRLRRSDRRSLEPRLRSRLDEMYVDLARHIDASPPLRVV